MFILERQFSFDLQKTIASVFFALTLLAGPPAEAQSMQMPTFSDFMVRHAEDWQIWSGIELCTEPDLTVKLGPKDESWWLQVADRRSGKRMPETGGFTMDFDRPVAAGEDCTEGGEGAIRVVCTDPTSGEEVQRVTDAKDCPLYDQFRTEFEAATSRQERSEVRRRYFYHLPRCLSIDPERVAANLRVVGSVFSQQEEERTLLDCNAPEVAAVEDLSQLAAADIKIGEHRPQRNVQRYLGISDQIVVYFSEPLKRDCEYQVSLFAGTLTDDGHCLAQKKEASFWVRPVDAPPFYWETVKRRFDPVTRTLVSFEMKEGVTVTREELWERYQKQLGLDLHDTMQEVAEPQAERHDPAVQYTDYRQFHKDFAVDGGQYRLRERDGYVIGGVGRVVSGITLDIEPEEDFGDTTAAAFDTARGAFGSDDEVEFIWEWKPSEFEEPEAQLLIVSEGGTWAPDSWRIAWRFKITAVNPWRSEIIDVDARDPDLIINRFDPTMSAYDEPPTPIPLPGFGESVDGEGMTLYDGSKKDFQVGEMTLEGETIQVLKLDQGLNTLMPPIVTYHHTVGENFDYIIDHDGNKVFDGCDAENPQCRADNPPQQQNYPEQKAGVSIHWALQKILSWIRERWNWIGLDNTGERPIYAFASEDSNWRGNLRHATFYPEGEPYPYPYLFFSIKHPNFKPVVAPEIAAHELCHGIIHYANPGSRYNSSLGRAIIEEGLCDFFGALAEFELREFGQGTSQPDWCVGNDVTLDGSCLRNIASPISVAGPTYNAIEAGCAGQELGCGRHPKGMVAAHALYLMVMGGAGVNENGCPYRVEQIGEGEYGSREQVASLVFRLMTGGWMATVDGFESARNAMMLVAAELFPAHGLPQALEVKTVQDAWAAVNVGYGADVGETYLYPFDGAVEVDPWPSFVGFEPSGDMNQRNWEIQISTSLAFDQDVQTKDVEISAQTGTREILVEDGSYRNLVGATFNLKSDIAYYWRLREKSDLPWGDCHLVQYFITQTKEPRLVSPRGAPSLGGDRDRVAYPWDAEIAWTGATGAAQFFVRVSDNPNDTCEEGGPAEREAYVTGQSGQETEYSHNFPLHADTPYFVCICSFGPEQVPGQCTNEGQGLPFRTKVPPGPELTYPPNDSRVPYNEDLLFTWETVKGAEEYELTLTPQGGGTIQIFNPGPGQTQHDVSADQASVNTSGYCWTVRAKGPFEDLGEESSQSCYQLMPATPRIVGPAVGTQNLDFNDVTLFWESDHAPHGYWIQVMPSGGVAFVDQAIDGTTLNLTGGTLQPSTTYVWRIYARDNDGSKMDSLKTEGNFTTMAVPEEPEEEEVRRTTGQCNTDMVAGGNWVDERTFNVGRDSGYLAIDYVTYTAQDKITIIYEGEEIWTSGCVGTGGDKGSEVWNSAFSISFSGDSEQITVRVDPGCNPAQGPTDKTEWIYFVHCPG